MEGDPLNLRNHKRIKAIEEALTEEDWNNRSLEIFQTFVCLYLLLKLVLPSDFLLLDYNCRWKIVG